MSYGAGEPVLHDVWVGGVSVWEAKFLQICLSTPWQRSIDKVQGDTGDVSADALGLLREVRKNHGMEEQLLDRP